MPLPARSDNNGQSTASVGESTAGGAATGAELGSYIGPEGTVVGGIIGGIVGFFGGLGSIFSGGGNTVPDLSGLQKQIYQTDANNKQSTADANGSTNGINGGGGYGGGLQNNAAKGGGYAGGNTDPANDPYAESDLNDTGNVSKGAYNAISNTADANAAQAYGQAGKALNQQAPTITNPYAKQSMNTLSGLQNKQGQAVNAYGQLAGQVSQQNAQLLQMANGTGTSAADRAFTAALGQNVAAQQAAAASAGGGAGYSAAARGAAANSGMQTQAAVNQLGQQKQAEQAQAISELQANQSLQGSLYGAQAGIENSQAGQAQAEYGLQQGVAGQQAGMTQQEQAQNNSAALGWTGQAYNDTGQDLSALEGYTVANAQQGGLAVSQSAQSTQAAQGYIGAGIQAGSTLVGGAGALSDARQKEDRKGMGKGDNPYDLDDDHPIAITFGAVQPSTFRYNADAAKAIGDDGRKHYGVMAQDLEKSPAGKSIVIETPAGKAIDLKGAAGLSLAALAHHEKRLKALEKGNPYDDASS